MLICKDIANFMCFLKPMIISHHSEISFQFVARAKSLRNFSSDVFLFFNYFQTKDDLLLALTSSMSLSPSRCHNHHYYSRCIDAVVWTIQANTHTQLIVFTTDAGSAHILSNIQYTNSPTLLPFRRTFFCSYALVRFSSIQPLLLPHFSFIFCDMPSDIAVHLFQVLLYIFFLFPIIMLMLMVHSKNI